jgi:hypothetical protein
MDCSTLENQQYSVLALYGIKHDVTSMAEFYTTAVEWCDTLGHIPNKSLVHGNSFSGKCISFGHNNKKLAKQGFTSVIDFELFTIPDGVKNPIFEYLIDIVCVGDNLGSYAIISINYEIAHVTGKSQAHVVQSIIQHLNPAYGIGYLRELRKGPSLYAVGIGQGTDTQEYSGDAHQESVRHAHWGYTGMKEEVYRQGIIRDIYPWNLLNKTHLETVIDGIPLKQWIETDQDRGSLRSVNNAWIWELNDSNIANVRPKLWTAGIIFNKQHYL